MTNYEKILDYLHMLPDTARKLLEILAKQSDEQIEIILRTQKDIIKKGEKPDSFSQSEIGFIYLLLTLRLLTERINDNKSFLSLGEDTEKLFLEYSQTLTKEKNVKHIIQNESYKLYYLLSNGKTWKELVSYIERKYKVDISLTTLKEHYNEHIKSVKTQITPSKKKKVTENARQAILYKNMPKIHSLKISGMSWRKITDYLNSMNILKISHMALFRFYKENVHKFDFPPINPYKLKK